MTIKVLTPSKKSVKQSDDNAGCCPWVVTGPPEPRQ